MNQKGVAPVAIVIIIALVGLFLISLDYDIEITRKDKTKSEETVENKVEEENLELSKKEEARLVDEDSLCENYGGHKIDPEDFLRTYSVREGDTVESIALSEFGSTSMATAIEDLNEFTSGVLFLRKGKEIYLPVDGFDYKEIGSFRKYEGKLNVNEEKQYFMIKAPTGSSGMMPFTIRAVREIKDLREGECVYVIYATNKNLGPLRVHDVGLQ